MPNGGWSAARRPDRAKATGEIAFQIHGRPGLGNDGVMNDRVGIELRHSRLEVCFDGTVSGFGNPDGRAHTFELVRVLATAHLGQRRREISISPIEHGGQTAGNALHLDPDHALIAAQELGRQDDQLAMHRITAERARERVSGIQPYVLRRHAIGLAIRYQQTPAAFGEQKRLWPVRIGDGAAQIVDEPWAGDGGSVHAYFFEGS